MRKWRAMIWFEVEANKRGEAEKIAMADFKTMVKKKDFDKFRLFKIEEA